VRIDPIADMQNQRHKSTRRAGEIASTVLQEFISPTRSG
jgi:hypothetical protein